MKWERERESTWKIVSGGEYKGSIKVHIVGVTSGFFSLCVALFSLSLRLYRCEVVERVCGREYIRKVSVGVTSGSFQWFLLTPTVIERVSVVLRC